MLALDHSPRQLSPQQLRVLALMEVDIYQRRLAPPPVRGWPEEDCASPLARALALAGGMADVGAWCSAWLDAGLTLPDLGVLRASPSAKRAFWQQLRARR